VERLAALGPIAQGQALFAELRIVQLRELPLVRFDRWYEQRPARDLPSRRAAQQPLQASADAAGNRQMGLGSKVVASPSRDQLYGGPSRVRIRLASWAG